MTATWDLYAKDLLRERPQDFVELILPGARYIARRESQFQMREIRLDRLIEVEYCGQRILINLEIQVAKDPRMGMRLLRYSLAALEEYDLPVLSCVIYLLGDLRGPVRTLVRFRLYSAGRNDDGRTAADESVRFAATVHSEQGWQKFQGIG